MISNTDMFHSSGDPLPGNRRVNCATGANCRVAAHQPRNRGDYVAFGRALLENPMYPDARVIEELAGVMSRRVFSANGGA